MKAAIYCRLSEEDREKKDGAADSESIQNQKSLLTKYAMDQGWEIYGTYADEDYSGTDASRPQFNEMLGDAKRGKFDILLCKTQSRFTRDMEIAERYLHNLFPLWNIRFVTLVDKVDTADKGGKKYRQLGGLINEWFLEDLSDNIRIVLTDKRKRGEFIGSFAPYGYKKSEKNTLAVDEEAATVVREIFQRYTKGEGISTISHSLNQRGTANPTGYRERNFGQLARTGRATKYLWSYGSVGRILRNEVYIGKLIQGKYHKLSYKNQKLLRNPRDQWIVCDNNHSPIVENEVFLQAQNRLSAKARPLSRGEGKNVFSIKARCAICGNTMIRHRSKGIDYLRCRTNAVYHKSCPGISIRCDVLEDVLIKEWNDSFSLAVNKIDGFGCITAEDSTDALIQSLKEKEKRGAKRLGELEKALMELYLDKTRGIVSNDQFTELSGKLILQKKEICIEGEVIKKEIQRLCAKKQSTWDCIKWVEKYRNISQFTCEMANGLIDHIDIGLGENKCDKTVNIYWNF